MRPEKWDPANKRLFFLLAHGCHAALDAPKKVPSEAVGQATRAAWSTAGLRRNSPRLPPVLGALYDVGLEVNSSKPYQGLPALTSFLQRERVALGTLFFPPPVLRLSGDAGEVLGDFARDNFLKFKAEWEYVPAPSRLKEGDVDRLIHVLQNQHTAAVPGSVPTAASLTPFMPIHALSCIFPRSSRRMLIP